MVLMMNNERAQGHSAGGDFAEEHSAERDQEDPGTDYVHARLRACNGPGDCVALHSKSISAELQATLNTPWASTLQGAPSQVA
jgi:hypothetical protein